MVDTNTTTALQGTVKQRKEEPKTAVIKIVPGEKPQVEFGGFWTGKYIQSAMNALSKAYRTRHHRLAYAKKQEADKELNKAKEEQKQGGENV